MVNKKTDGKKNTEYTFSRKITGIIQGIKVGSNLSVQISDTVEDIVAKVNAFGKPKVFFIFKEGLLEVDMDGNHEGVLFLPKTKTELSSVKLYNNAKMETDVCFYNKELTFDLSGNAHIDIYLKTDICNVTTKGNSSAILNGNVKKLSLVSTGNSSFDGKSLSVANTTIEAACLSEIVVRSDIFDKITLTNAAHLEISRNAKIVQRDTKGISYISYIN